MKKMLYLFIAFTVVSCSSGTKTDYQKTIANYVQTDKKGTKYDLKFKVLELQEQGTITVADSVSYLTEEFRKDKEHLIKRFELAKKMDETLLAKEKKQSSIDQYKNDIAATERSIDSLKNLIPDNLNGYESLNANDILTRIIRCKYSIALPSGIAGEETFDFYLSTDGSMCYGKTRVK